MDSPPADVLGEEIKKKLGLVGKELNLQAMSDAMERMGIRPSASRGSAQSNAVAVCKRLGMDPAVSAAHFGFDLNTFLHSTGKLVQQKIELGEDLNIDSCLAMIAGHEVQTQNERFERTRAFTSPPERQNGGACWGCGTLPTDGPFKSCGKCLKEKLVPCVFCSQVCLAAHWPRHKDWHAQQRAVVASTPKLPTANSLTAGDLDALESDPRPYNYLMASAMKLSDDGKYKKAVKVFRKAIAVLPHHPMAHFNLGIALDRSNDQAGAAISFLRGIECFDKAREYGADWAKGVCLAFSTLVHPACAAVPKPTWWTHEKLIDLSSQVVTFHPNDSQACIMRASVICGLDVHLMCRWRGFNDAAMSRGQLEEAGAYFTHAAAILEEAGISLQADQARQRAAQVQQLLTTIPVPSGTRQA